MDPAVSSQLVWALANQEAGAARFAAIEPGHFLNAVLKFSEMDERRIGDTVQNSDQTMLEALVSDCDIVRRKLDEFSIGVPQDSRTIRRRLRQRMGKGAEATTKGEVLHRSDASRMICKQAETVASKAGEVQWHAVHLLEALLDSPTAEISGVLTDAGKAPSRNTPQETPLLNRIGKDLTALAAAGKLGATVPDGEQIKKDAVCKVVIQELIEKNTKNILLIETGGRSAEEVVNTLATVFASGLETSGSKSKRLVTIKASLSQITKGKKPSELAQEVFEEKIYELLQEVSKSPHVILCLSHFQEFVGAKRFTDVSLIVKEFLTQELIQCIATTDSASYAKYLERNADWKNLFRTVSIHEVKVPHQL